MESILAKLMIISLIYLRESVCKVTVVSPKALVAKFNHTIKAS